jgi:diphthamide synthase (EF-2-diphthine--ammonia ligase)
MATPVAFSWSAGKDSAVGLWTVLRDPGYEVRALLTTINEGYDRVSISGVREELLDRQTSALQLPLIKVRIPPTCTTEEYEERLATALAGEDLNGVERVAFGDLFLEDVRAHREEHLSLAGKRWCHASHGRQSVVGQFETGGRMPRRRSIATCLGGRRPSSVAT